MFKDKRGISTLAIVGFSFIGLVALAVIFKITSGQGFQSSSHTGLPGQSQNVLGNSHNNAAGANAGELAPDFSLTSLDGKQITLSDYRGQKPVVLDFFATWCPNCRRDMPKQQALYEKYNGQVEVIAIDLNESLRTVEKYIADNNFTFPVVMDPGGRVARDYNVRFTNTHVYINKEGFIDHTNYQDTTDTQFRSLIN